MLKYKEILQNFQIQPENYNLTQFSRQVLFCAEVEIVAITLPKDYQFPLHYHQDSAVYTKILTGKVEEIAITPENQSNKILLEISQEYYLPAFSFHKLYALEPTLMINVYDPPISNKNQKITIEQEKYLENLLIITNIL